MVSLLGRRTREPLLYRGDEATSFEESFRVLRSNLEVALSDVEHPTVVITSSKANEGKTVVCTELGLSFADAGYRVVLVDLDLRHPSAYALLRAHNEFGVSDVLLGDRNLKDCLQQVEVRGSDGRTPRSMYFLATGPEVHNPTELLGTRRATQLLEGLSRQADLVLIDTAPVLPVADTLVIGRGVSGALLVVEARTTAIGAVKQSKDLLIRNQTRLLGVVVNKFHSRDAVGTTHGYYPYGYGYGYGSRARTVRPRAIPDGEREPLHSPAFEDASSEPTTNGSGVAGRGGTGPPSIE